MTETKALRIDAGKSEPTRPMIELNSGGYPLSELEKSVVAAVEERHAKRPLTAHERALGQLAMEVARNITMGNRKGRALANEAIALKETLAAITGEDDTDQATGEGLPADVLSFIDAVRTA